MYSLLIRSLYVVLLSGSCIVVYANTDTPTTPQLAPGYGKLEYTLPTIGSYNLPPMGKATDGDVISMEGKKTSLYQVFDGKYILLTFIYSTCDDVNGCPLTSYVFYKIKSAMRNNPQLAKHLKLVSLSFDPKYDTPTIMKLYGNNFNYAGNAGEWEFLTTESTAKLDPILAAYNQDIQRRIDEKGNESVGYNHIIRVFLIDPRKRIRNIYSVAFLHSDLAINDVQTLITQEQTNPIQLANNTHESKLSVPGDYKEGYETSDYETQTLAVELRKGIPADLMQFVKKPPLGLPPIKQPSNNQLTAKKIALGRELFFDRRLSLNNTFSCAMCHVPEQGFTSNELAMAVGLEGRSVRRNSPTIYNIAYSTKLFHDGREDNLEHQVWSPLLAKNEMANPSIGYVLNKLRNIPSYKGKFEAAFNGQGISMQTVGMALASYERVLVSGNSPFDRWYYGKQNNAISESAKRGFNVFSGKASCIACHHVGKKSALFSDNKLHNTGIGYRNSMGIAPKKQRVVLAPGVFVDVEKSIIDSVSEPKAADLGLYEITQNPADRWKYRTPGLRNITLTAPYMHDGSLSTLEDVIEFYDQGGIQNEVLDPLMRPLNLTEQEKSDLLAFMQTLTGSNVDLLVSDAFAAPVGDITRQDPDWVHGSEVEVK